MSKLSRILLIIFSIVVVSCSPSADSDSLFSELEKNYESDPSKGNLTALLKAYNSHILENWDDVKVAKKAYDLSVANNIPNAPTYLIGLIKNADPGSKQSSDWLYQLGSDLEKQGQIEASQVIFGNLLKRFPAHAEVATIKSKVSAEPQVVIEQLTESRLRNPDQYGINKAEGFKYVNACEAYALSAPDDPKSPGYLFDAAEIAKLLKTYNKALELYDWLISKYPTSSKTPSALFIKAFTLENELGRQDEAKAAYELFLKKYPNDNFADDAQFSLDNIGKSPEEVLKAIEAKSKGNQ